jgi:acetyl esterase/lipase
MKLHEQNDYIPARLFGKFSKMYAAGKSLEAVSAKSLALQGFPPIHMEVGGGELLLDQCRAFRHTLEAAGNRVAYHESPGMVHVFV